MWRRCHDADRLPDAHAHVVRDAADCRLSIIIQYPADDDVLGVRGCLDIANHAFDLRPSVVDSACSELAARCCGFFSHHLDKPSQPVVDYSRRLEAIATASRVSGSGGFNGTSHNVIVRDCEPFTKLSLGWSKSP